MTPTDEHDDAYEHNEDVAHEHSDINIRTVLLAALALAVVVAVVQVAMSVLFNVLEHQGVANDPQPSPLAVPAGQLPPKPSIIDNQHEPARLRELLATEAKTLAEYGWIDQKAGVAHVPIEEAKKLLLERGLPARAGTVNPLEGTHAPAYGEANGGRSLARPRVSR